MLTPGIQDCCRPYRTPIYYYFTPRTRALGLFSLARNPLERDDKRGGLGLGLLSLGRSPPLMMNVVPAAQVFWSLGLVVISLGSCAACATPFTLCVQLPHSDAICFPATVATTKVTLQYLLRT
jgi:hypothetical protein